ncbi:MAG: MaoC/PaaZ C-terminal domain-containing protein [Thermodesulfobacteriota bacterium]|jgi:acyl dehydratase
MQYKIQGKYFEDWKVGDKFETSRRTITEADAVFFVGLSGDYNLLYTNEEFAKRTVFGTRIPHEFLVYSISSGLMNTTTYFDGTLISQKSHKNVEFAETVFNEDTIYAKVKVLEKNDMGKPDLGEIVFDVEIINQKGEVCIKGNRSYLIKKRKQTG